MIKRCDWVNNKILEKYHDLEWGIPINNDKKLFEFLVLDGMQAGLSWEIILKKRIDFRNAFHNFDPTKIAKFTSQDVRKLLENKKIIRNKQKINSIINNAKRFLEIKNGLGSFHDYLWSFVSYKTIQNKYKKWSDIPDYNKEAIAMSQDLKKRGFTFVGPTICYAFMQSVGMVNDHIISCFRYNQLK